WTSIESRESAALAPTQGNEASSTKSRKRADKPVSVAAGGDVGLVWGKGHLRAVANALIWALGPGCMRGPVIRVPHTLGVGAPRPCVRCTRPGPSKMRHCAFVQTWSTRGQAQLFIREAPARTGQEEEAGREGRQEARRARCQGGHLAAAGLEPRQRASLRLIRAAAHPRPRPIHPP